MMNLSSKFRKFKADNIVVIWSEKYWTKIQWTADDFFLTSKIWLGGWVVIFYPLRVSLFSGMLTSIMYLFQIWCQKLSNAFRSEVVIDLSLKFGKIKADIIVVNWSEKIVDKNTMDCWRFFSHIKNMIFHPKTSKIPNLQKWYQNGSKPII